jgi:2-C-methyl-D-erythritol 4-phosphate cytidylyltransferase
MKNAAIIPAGGSGLRMGYKIPKPYLSFDSLPIIVHTLRIFQNSELIDDVYLVVQEKDKVYAQNQIVDAYSLSKVRAIISGGRERQDSVNNALNYLSDEHEIVVIHDGVRPLLENSILENIIKVAIKEGAAITGMPVKDTIKVINTLEQAEKTLDREKLFMIQTPQAFDKDMIVRAYKAACEDHFRGTDDSSLVERLGIPVKVIRGSYENIKITTQEDLLFAEFIAQSRKRCAEK